MSNRTSGNAGGRSVDEPGHDASRENPVPEHLDEAECLRLISSGGVGRLAYSGQFGPTVLPVLYKAYVGYIAHEHILGLSKLTRLVRLFAWARPSSAKNQRRKPAGRQVK